MRSSIDAIEQTCHQQVKKADELLRSLEKFGWKDTRPARTKEKRETSFGLLDFGGTTVTLATARIPDEFIHAYHDWYSASLALVEGNMPARLNEMLAQHEGVKGTKDGPTPVTHLLQGGRMTFDQQIRIASRHTPHEIRRGQYRGLHTGSPPRRGACGRAGLCSRRAVRSRGVTQGGGSSEPRAQWQAYS